MEAFNYEKAILLRWSREEVTSPQCPRPSKNVSDTETLNVVLSTTTLSKILLGRSRGGIPCFMCLGEIVTGISPRQ